MENREQLIAAGALNAAELKAARTEVNVSDRRHKWLRWCLPLAVAALGILAALNWQAIRTLWEVDPSIPFHVTDESTWPWAERHLEWLVFGGAMFVIFALTGWRMFANAKSEEDFWKAWRVNRTRNRLSDSRAATEDDLRKAGLIK